MKNGSSFKTNQEIVVANRLVTPRLATTPRTDRFRVFVINAENKMKMCCVK
jgi:hypothetical protein